MKSADYHRLLEPIVDAAAERGDAMLTVVFCREDDRYLGLHDGMDAADALLVIHELIDAFGLNTIALAHAINPPGKVAA